MSNDQEPLRNWLCFYPSRLVPLDDVGGDDYQAAVVWDPDDEETVSPCLAITPTATPSIASGPL